MRTRNLIQTKPFKPVCALVLGLGFLFTSCSGGGGDQQSSESDGGASAEEKDKQAMIEKGLGIGPVKELKLEGEVDQAMAEEGKQIFKNKCTSCHKVDKEHIGPALQGVLDRRKPEWVINMILNPEEMVQEDPTGQELLAEYNSVMARQVDNQEEARKIIEYFRTLKSE